MLRPRILLLIVVGALSAGGSAAYAATHGPAQPAKQPVAKKHYLPPNVHYPCHSAEPRLSPSQL